MRKMKYRRTCKTCKVIIVVPNMNVWSSTKYCAKCAEESRLHSARKARQRWAMRNPDKMRESYHRYYQRNRDRINARNLERYHKRVEAAHAV